MRFRGILLTLALLVSLLVPGTAAAARGGAWVVAEQKVGDRLLELTVHSAAVGQDVGVRLLLPPDFARFPHRTWPTLYLLHGCCDGDHGYTDWTDLTDVTEFTAHTDVLIVMPDGGPAGFYSNWLDGPAWETFHLTELRRLLERDYRAGSARAIAGLSMGGFGALSYAARHPGLFRAAASYSGVVHTTYQGARSTDVLASIVSGTGADPNALWGDPVADARVWAAHNPYDLAYRLRDIPVFLSAGNGEPGPFEPPGTGPDSLEKLLGEQSAAVADRLERLHGHVVTDFYGPGQHRWAYWERELHRSFPLLVRAIT